MNDLYEIRDVPKSHKWQTKVREKTRKFLDKHLSMVLGEICVQYLYIPTFQNMSCIDTCGILKVPMMNRIVVNYRPNIEFHNARCPDHPDQCIICGSDVRDLQCKQYCLHFQNPPNTDQPFIDHDRNTMVTLANKEMAVIKFTIACIILLPICIIETQFVTNIFASIAGGIILGIISSVLAAQYVRYLLT